MYLLRHIGDPCPKKKYSVETGKWGYDTLMANILVKDVAQLTSVMENLRGMKGVQNVKRIGGVM